MSKEINPFDWIKINESTPDFKINQDHLQSHPEYFVEFEYDNERYFYVHKEYIEKYCKQLSITERFNRKLDQLKIELHQKIDDMFFFEKLINTYKEMGVFFVNKTPEGNYSTIINGKEYWADTPVGIMQLRNALSTSDKETRIV